MQELRVIGVESGALLVATDAGSEFRLPVTGALQSQVRQADPDAAPVVHRVSPREIQARIRAGRTAEQVAADTGADLDYVRRFEGPVLDERAFLLESARAVSVSVAGLGGSDSSRFGEVIDARLDEADATGREWTAFKDDEGWVVRVAYTTSEIEREAVWRFDPKRQGLSPAAGDAHTLSRQDADHANLVPRLRAVAHPGERGGSDQAGAGSGPSDAGRSGSAPSGSALSGSALPGDDGRFDSGAFEVQQELSPEPAPLSAHARAREGWSAASLAAMNRAPETESQHNQTADLLEALRRRRGEREAARFGDDDPLAEAKAAHPSTGSIRVIDVPLDSFRDDVDESGADEAGLDQTGAYGGDAPGAPASDSSGRDETAERSARPRRTPSVWDAASRGTGAGDAPEPPRATKPLATHPTAARGTRQAPADDAPRSPTQPEARKTSRARRGRASMPSWDEIVFGARSDDDPA